jgi:DNA-directed RNA polymerase subunit RPC12/RpoP
VIHMPCPGCPRQFELADVLRGQIITCPDCGKRMLVEPPEVELKVETDAAAILLAETGPSGEIQEWLEEPAPTIGVDPKRLKARHLRKKKKRRSAEGTYLAEQWTYFTGGFGPFVYVLLGLFAFWVLMLLLTPLVPRISLLLSFIGSVLSMFGWLWIVLIAYRDDGWSGTMCLFTFFYAYVYAILNVDLSWKAGGLMLLGLLMQVSGFATGLYFGGTKF